jgi:hypothetical protein
VEIVHDTVPPTTINLMVRTHDKWTKIIETSYKQDGGEYQALVAAKDYNFWGKGKGVGATVDYRSGRDEPYGLKLTFSDRRLLDSRWAVNWLYQDNNDQERTAISTLRPFYATEAIWSAGASFDRGQEVVSLYTLENGGLEQKGRVRYDRESIMGIYARPGQPAWYFGGAVLRRRATSDTITLSGLDNLDMASVLVASMHRTYYADSGLDNFSRVEDVPVGYAVNLITGAALFPPSSDAFDYYSLISAQYAQRWQQRWYVSGMVNLTSYWEKSAWNTSRHQVAAGLLQHVRLPGRQLLVARITTQLGYRWPERRQIILDSPHGLRGYPANRFSGQRMVLCNLEDRFNLPFALWIFRLGGVLFTDVGTVWDQGETLGKTRWYTACGAGLRVGNIKQQGGGVTRIDFSYSLERRCFAQLTITSGQMFSAFRDLDILYPDTVNE